MTPYLVANCHCAAHLFWCLDVPPASFVKGKGAVLQGPALELLLFSFYSLGEIMEALTGIAAIDSQELNRRASNIKVLLMDVDGVLTDGSLYYLPGENGSLFETKGFNSQDGLGLHFCSVLSIKTGVISGRESAALSERVRLLKMSYVYQGLLKKQGAYQEILDDAGVKEDQTAYIGDDLTDVPLLRKAGLAVAVANAREEVKQAAHYVTAVPGGSGAVREVVELIIKAQGRWQEALEHFQISLP